MAKDVNATGIVGMNGLSLASSRLPMTHARAAGVALVEDDHADAPAAWAFSTFTPKLQLPRWISAIRPDIEPVKSAAVQPLVELESASAG